MAQAGNIALAGGGTTWQASLEQEKFVGTSQGKLATWLLLIVIPVLANAGKC